MTKPQMWVSAENESFGRPPTAGVDEPVGAVSRSKYPGAWGQCVSGEGLSISRSWVRDWLRVKKFTLGQEIILSMETIKGLEAHKHTMNHVLLFFLPITKDWESGLLLPFSLTYDLQLPLGGWLSSLELPFVAILSWFHWHRCGEGKKGPDLHPVGIMLNLASLPRLPT